MNNQTIATSPSQSQRLQACGVDPKTADMCWSKHFHLNLANKILQLRKPQYSDDSPAWSTSRLLELLPKKIKGNEYIDDYYFSIKYDHCCKDFPWTIKYENSPLFKNKIFMDKSLIEVCVKAIEWLTKEGYKLNKIEE